MSVAIATAQNYENFSNKRSCELLFLQKYDNFVFLKEVANLFSWLVDKIEKCGEQNRGGNFMFFDCLFVYLQLTAKILPLAEIKYPNKFDIFSLA